MSSATPVKKKPGIVMDLSPATKKKNNLWKPDNSYKLTLREIKEQKTPSGIYRHILTTTVAEDRFLRRLEWRGERRLENWTRCATIVKAGFRGMKCRRHINSIRHKLEVERQQRNAKFEAVEAFAKGEKQTVLDIISTVKEMNGELWVVKAKVFYTMSDMDNAFYAGEKATAWPKWEIDGRYIMACVYVRKQELLAAYDQLTMLGVLGDQRINTRRLRGYVAARMVPPEFEDGVDALSRVVDDCPEDLNLRLHRALVRCCNNDFSKAVEDFTLILRYQPTLDLVQYLRARAYSCMRRWKAAQADYEMVLERIPDDAGTLLGLQEITTPIRELPMLVDESEIDLP
jgi:tetratricopeptide (TPR) repeat protein